jgi:class 3 adenylate cyclase/tetratricopeptide (TPR) repeat protein
LDVAALLRSVGLEQYEQAFRDNHIDGVLLPRLTAEDLRDLGVTAVGHRRRLLDAIAALGNEKTVASTDADTAASEGERRPVTVLFADLTGYAGLSRDLDPEDIHALMRRFFEAVDAVIEFYGGWVDKHIGDCVMAVFGAPVAHGDDPERAARAALDVHAAMRELSRSAGRLLQVHAGIASGEVVFAHGARSRTLTGDAVNLAARLTDLAGPDETLASDAFRLAAGAGVELEAVGEADIKGFDRSVVVWRLRGVRGGIGAGRAGARRFFVGRSTELAQFRGALQTCRTVGHGLTVHIRGEAGVGKSRVVEEFKRLAEAEGFACHTGLVLDFGTGKGRGAIRSVVRGLLGLASTEIDEAHRRAALERAIAEGIIAAERRLFLNDLLDLPQSRDLQALYGAMDQATRDRGIRDTILALVRRQSARRPRLIVVEDLHWAVPSTLARLATLGSATGECPVVLVTTARLAGDPLGEATGAPAAARRTPAVTMELPPLRRDEALALVDHLFGARDRFALNCVERAEGNPLFLEHLLRSRDDVAGRAGLPTSIQSVVLARVDALSVPDKRALQAASVLGQRFALDALRYLLADPQYDPAGLARHHLVGPEDDPWLFAHALIREVVYGALLSDRRRSLHRRAAEWFAEGRDPVLHAGHLDRAGEPEAPRAYLEAARSEAAAFRSEPARSLAERGLALAIDLADVWALTWFLGEVLHDLGRTVESMGAYERALDVSRNDTERCRAWIGLADVCRLRDEVDRALGLLDQAEQAARRSELAPELGRVHHLRGNLRFWGDQIDDCLDEHRRALEIARRIESPKLTAQALSGLGDAACLRGRMVSAYDTYRRCLELCERHGFKRIEVANRSQLVHTGVHFRPVPAALEDAIDALEGARQVGHRRAELNALSALIRALFELKDLDVMRRHADETLALADELGARGFVVTPYVFLARAAHAEGRRAEALSFARKSFDVAQSGERMRRLDALSVLALVTEDIDQRERALDEGGALIRRGAREGAGCLWFYRDAMEGALGRADWEAAERHALALETLTRPERLVWADFCIARARALAVLGRITNPTAGAIQELHRLRNEGERMGYRTGLAAIEQALGA